MKVEGFNSETGLPDAGDDKNEPSNFMDSVKGNTNNILVGNNVIPTPTHGNTYSGNISATTSAALIADLKDHAVELHATQKKIINGFETIAPHMDRAENLLQSINGTAKTIQSMRNMQ